MKADGTLATTMENHYKTFIVRLDPPFFRMHHCADLLQTEEDFAQIAGAGLNFVRIPIAYWAIETRDDDPFLAHVSWKYFLKAIQWARKYGIRINLDLHVAPGSQNGYNHSGKGRNQVRFLNGVMGYANAQRMLDYIRIFAEFISQPQYSNVVTMLSVLNEPSGSINADSLDALCVLFHRRPSRSPLTRTPRASYLQAYQIVRKASGNGQGPWVTYHDSFRSLDSWAGYMPGADRIALDTHQYFAFGDTPITAPLATIATLPCTGWTNYVNGSMAAFGVTVGGEYSNGWNDCGL